MEVNDALLDKLCNLAKLNFEGPARAAIKQDLTNMLAFVEKINELDTTGVQPLIHLTPELNRLRDDVVEPPIDHALALKNAPKKDSDYFRVPKVLDK
jgi:aspartyl-tRNA(Asn)/glutamyl-tRNA(Gln) amidotransferase subunit C